MTYIKVALLAILGLLLATPGYARIDYHGFYFTQTLAGDRLNLQYMEELRGFNNVIKLSYNPFSSSENLPALVDKVKANGYKSIAFNLDLTEDLFTNRNNARTEYLQALKRKFTNESSLASLISMFHILEEEYTLLRQGYFERVGWTVFNNIDVNQCRQEYNNPYLDLGDCRGLLMKKNLEAYISDVKTYFPGIPVIIVENYWGYTHVPPSNLDILGIDAYFIPTSPACDDIQRARFDDSVTSVFNMAKQYGKPLYMVGPVFDDGNFRMLSDCQTQWYIDLAKNTPEIIGLDWFLYADVDGVRGVRNYSGSPVDYLKAKGSEIIANANHPIPGGSVIIDTGNFSTPSRGTFDTIIMPEGIIAGWAYDPDHPSDNIPVHFYIDGPAGSGRFMGSTVTDISRPDVNAAFNIQGTHGFGFTIPEQYRDNVSHLVYAYSIDIPTVSGNNTHIVSSPRSFILPPTVIADTTAPSVSISSPATNSTASGTITISATASDNVGVSGVQFKIDGANLGPEDTTSPYSASLNTTLYSNGTHTISAVARDAAGNTQVSNISVMVNNQVADTTAPVISNVSTSSVGTSVATITWSTNEVSDSQVEFCTSLTRCGFNTPLVSALVSTHTINLSGLSPATNYYFWVKSKDASGNLATSQSSFSTSLQPDVTLPSVSISSPATNSTASGTITISATASDNVGVSGVQFKIDGANLGPEDTTSPYSASLNTTLYSNGTHTISAVARDAAGNTATSNMAISISNVVIDITPPVISSLGVSDLTPNSARIFWSTNESADSQVEICTTETACDNNTALQVGARTSHSVSLSNLIPGTNYYIWAKSRDGSGNRGISQSSFTTPLENDVISPTVSLSSLATTNISGTQTVSATASDNVGVSGVQFKIDGANLGPEDTTSPYSASLNTTLYSNGTHTISATARDAAGNTATSSLITITIANVTIPDLVIHTTPSLPQGIIGSQYSTYIEATGGAQSYEWGVSSGKLPPGLSLITGACVTSPCRIPVLISGTPTSAGEFRFSIFVSSGTNQRVSKDFSIVVRNPLVPEKPVETVPTRSIPVVRFDGDPRVFQVVEGNRLKWIPTLEVFNNLQIPWQDVSVQPPAARAKYARAKLIRALNDEKVYYVTEGGLKRWMNNQEVFLSYGNRWEDVVIVTPLEVAAIPDNILIRSAGDPRVFKLEVQGGVVAKRWIRTAEAFNRAGFNWGQIAPVNTLEMSAYPTGEDIN